MRLWWSQGRELDLWSVIVEVLGLTRLTPSIPILPLPSFSSFWAAAQGTTSSTGARISSTSSSTDGRIFQVEYASKAVENGGTALGLKCRDGVVLAVEKPVLNKMLLPTSNRRIHSVDEAHGVAVTGFVADARQIVNRARDEAIGYEET